LRFLVTEKPRNTPFTDLQIEHEKFMHVVGMRNDLTEFFHIHPVQTSPGNWEVNHTFVKPGKYKIWTDQKFRGVSYSIGQPFLEVRGKEGHPEKPGPCGPGCEVVFSPPQKLVSGTVTELTVLVTDHHGTLVALENYLGSPMHLIIVSSNLGTYLHAHPESGKLPNGALLFRPTFPHEGRYKLIAQYRPAGTELSADQALLAESWVTVTAHPPGQDGSPGLPPNPNLRSR
jgi:hypothetical protein